MERTIEKHQISKKFPLSMQQTLSAFGIILLLGLALWMVISQWTTSVSQNKLDAAVTAFEEDTGIRVVRIVLTGGGGIVDLQYQVVDPDKALIVHDADNPPMMIDEKHNYVFANPFHEHADRELHTAVIYHEMIMNGAGVIERGSKITLIVGDSILEGIIVQ